MSGGGGEVEAADPRHEILERLRREGLQFERLGCTDDYVPSEDARSRFSRAPVLTLPIDVLQDYVRGVARSCNGLPDPGAEAFDLAALGVVESLTVDHGDGLNATVAVGFRRRRDSTAEFYVEQDPAEASISVDEPLEWTGDRPS